MKLLFEKIRKKKEREAEKIIFDEKKNDEKTSLDEKRIDEKKITKKVCESKMGPVFAQKSLFGAGPIQDSRGERQKSVRDLINTLEENINEKDEKKPKISTAKNTRKKIDILRMKSSPISISKKSVTPTRKSKFSEKKSQKNDRKNLRRKPYL